MITPSQFCAIVSQCGELEVLEGWGSDILTDNSLAGVKWSQLFHLRELNLELSGVTPQGLRYFSENSQLKVLRGCQGCTDADLAWISVKFRLLEDLRLPLARITERGLPPLISLPLRRLDFLGAFRLTDSALGVLGKITTLRSLSLSFAGITDSSLPLLVGCPLETLSLANCPLTDKGVKILSFFPTLQSLSLSHCYNISNQGVDALSALKNLRHLSLQGCDVSPDTCQRLLRLPPSTSEFSSSSVPPLISFPSTSLASALTSSVPFPKAPK